MNGVASGGGDRRFAQLCVKIGGSRKENLVVANLERAKLDVLFAPCGVHASRTSVSIKKLIIQMNIHSSTNNCCNIVFLNYVVN